MTHDGGLNSNARTSSDNSPGARWSPNGISAKEEGKLDKNNTDSGRLARTAETEEKGHKRSRTQSDVSALNAELDEGLRRFSDSPRPAQNFDNSSRSSPAFLPATSADSTAATTTSTATTMTTHNSRLSPQNALRLQIEPDTNAQRRQQPILTVIPPSPADAAVLPSISTDASPTTPRSPRVRFRSRVRITSGLHHHRHSLSGAIGSDTSKPTAVPKSSLGATSSARSSMSGSPSSSISAPLRSQSDDEANAWGPLGRRVSFFAWQRRVSRGQGNGGGSFDGVRAWAGEGDRGERAPLVSGLESRRYNGGYDRSAAEERAAVREERERLAREVDAIFGPWPRRLLNHQWWWWQIEPVICCHCLEEFEPDD